MRTHPETGKRALVYAEGFIDHVVGVSQAESDMVLKFLREHVADVSLHCRWQWREGDLAIWDERSTLHRAAGTTSPNGVSSADLRSTATAPTSIPTVPRARRGGWSDPMLVRDSPVSSVQACQVRGSGVGGRIRPSPCGRGCIRWHRRGRA